MYAVLLFRNVDGDLPADVNYSENWDEYFTDVRNH